MFLAGGGGRLNYTMSGTQSLFTMPQELSSLASKLFSSTTTSTSNTGATETQSEDTTPTPNIELSSPANGANKGG